MVVLLLHYTASLLIKLVRSLRIYNISLLVKLVRSLRIYNVSLLVKLKDRGYTLLNNNVVGLLLHRFSIGKIKGYRVYTSNQ